MTTKSRAATDLLRESLAIAFDGGRDIVELRAGTRPDPGRSVCRTFLTLPGPRNPQLLVEEDAAGGAATSLRRFSVSRPWQARAVSGVVRAALRMGLAAHLPKSRWLAVCRPEGDRRALLPDVLADMLGVPDVKLAIRTGRPRPNRKPVLQVSAADGGVLAFVKVGWNPLTRQLVRQEAAALTRISALQQPPRTFRIPEVRWAGPWESIELLILEPLPEIGAGRWRRRTPPLEPTDEIGRMHGSAWHALEDCPYWAGLRGRVAALADDADRAAVHAAAVQLEDRNGATKLECGTWHGDWTAGNMATRDGRLLVYDWERSATGVPLGLDTAYLLIHRGLTRGVPPRRALPSARTRLTALLDHLRTNQHAARLLVDVSLLELAVRFLEARRHNMGVDGALYQHALAQSLEEHV